MMPPPKVLSLLVPRSQLNWLNLFITNWYH
ncbi:hypothetical protein SBY92_001235 [Candida maltosa Xu316]